MGKSRLWISLPRYIFCKRTQFITTMQDGKVFMCLHGEKIKRTVNYPGKDALSFIREKTIMVLAGFDKQNACTMPGEKCWKI